MKSSKTIKESYRELIILALAGAVAMFVVLLPLGNILADLKLTFTYTVLIYLPFLPLIDRIKGIGMVEKFVLSNFAGLTLSAVYVILDVIFKIPLTRTLFLLVPLAVLSVTLITRK